MSDDLIKRSDAIKAVSKVDDYGDGIGSEVRSHCLVELELVPSVNRPQGEWTHAHVGTIAEGDYCSNCGKVGYGSNPCPNCGAQMKGLEKDE